jgi:hypothetical protein
MDVLNQFFGEIPELEDPVSMPDEGKIKMDELKQGIVEDSFIGNKLKEVMRTFQQLTLLLDSATSYLAELDFHKDHIFNIIKKQYAKRRNNEQLTILAKQLAVVRKKKELMSKRVSELDFSLDKLHVFHDSLLLLSHEKELAQMNINIGDDVDEAIADIQDIIESLHIVNTDSSSGKTLQFNFEDEIDVDQASVEEIISEVKKEVDKNKGG